MVSATLAVKIEHGVRQAEVMAVYCKIAPVFEFYRPDDNDGEVVLPCGNTAVDCPQVI
jgi:hypothetical protein